MKWYKRVFSEVFIYKWMVNKALCKSKVNLGSVLIIPKCMTCKCYFSYPHRQFKGGACEEKWKIWQAKGIIVTLKFTSTEVIY